MIVQVYEIQTPWEAEICIGLGVNHIGSVILDPEAWRKPELRETIRQTAGTPVKSSMIPLFQDRKILYQALDYYRPDLVHFCNDLTGVSPKHPDPTQFASHMQADCRRRFPEIGIIRTVPVPAKGIEPGFSPLEMARDLGSVSDFFLLDTWSGMEPVSGYIGITGILADWGMARAVVHQSPIPVILAGGLSPENVYNALMIVAPAGADSCTLTNRVDAEGRPVRFVKDFHKVAAFVREVRRAEKAHGEKIFQAYGAP